MDAYTSSSGLQHIVAYGPHSVVLSHPYHNHHHHSHSLPPRSTSAYQLVPLVPAVPTTIYVPVQQRKQQSPQRHQQPQSNYI